MGAFFAAQGIASLAGSVLLLALGGWRLPTGLFVLTAWLVGSGALAVERLLLAQAGLTWAARDLLLPWAGVAAIAVLRIGRTRRNVWRAGGRLLRARLGHPIPFGFVIEVAVVALLLGWTAALLWQATNLPLDGWDAWAMWFLKGRALYQAGTVSPNLLTDAHYAPYAHLDYPLLVPLTIAQTYAWIGDLDPLMKGWWALLAGAAAGGIYWGLAGVVGRVARLGGLVLLLTVPELVKHAAGYYAGYADLPLAVLFLYGALFLYRWVRRPDAAAFALAAICFCLMGLAKNEGLVAGPAGLALLGGLAVVRRRLTWLEVLAAGAAIGLILLPWQWEKATLGLTGDIQPTWALVQANWRERIDPIWNGLTLMAASPYHFALAWPILPLLGLGALLFRPRRWLATLPLLALVTASLGGAVLAYIVTPHDLSWHLHTSVDRVVFQPSLVLLLLGTLYLGLLLDRGPWRAHNV